DDPDGDGAIVASRVLDDRAERERPRLQAGNCCSGARVGRIFTIAADTAASTLANILSAGRHEVVSAATAATRGKIHNHRPVVLGWGSGSRRGLSRFVEEVRLPTIS